MNRNLGAAPVEHARNEKSGSIVGFSLAENVWTFDKESGEDKTVHTNWFQVTIFGPLAERVNSSLKKGDRVAVQGQIRSSRYTDKSGEEKMGFETVAEDAALWQTLGHTAAPAPSPQRHPDPVAAPVVMTRVNPIAAPISPATRREKSLPF